MNKSNIVFLFFIIFFIRLDAFSQKKYSSKLQKNAIRIVVNDVAKWQVNAYPDMNKDRHWKAYGDLSWENGVFLSSLASWAEFDKNETFIKWYEGVADRNFWQLLGNQHRIYFGDDLAVALMYTQLYDKRKDDRIIHPTQARLEFIANNPSSSSLYKGSLNSSDRWCWADALYMAPPVFAKYAGISGNQKLLDFMDSEFWASYDFLYDKEERLFYRDSNYFNKIEKNGKKVFWGRGNAWVVAGLALLIPELPKDYPSRDKYVHLFKEMMHRIVTLQNKEGYWHSSMLDTETYTSPETSSTGFFTYALWWGINNEILDKETCLGPAKLGWKALVNAVHPSGMLGWVQPVGADPQKVTKDMTEVYGAGAFMRTGQEIIKYLNKAENQN